MRILDRASVSIVVVNYASSQLLLQNLRRVQAEAPEVNIVVVDNFTTMRERESVSAMATEFGWSVELLDENRGFGGGCNAGVARAESDGSHGVLLLNPDAFIAGGDLDALIAASNSLPYSICTPIIERSDGRVWFDGMEVCLDDGSMRRSSLAESQVGQTQRWLTGACMLISMEVWHRLGGFTSKYFLYWEDVDLSARAGRLGVALVVVRKSLAIHDAGGTQRHEGVGKSPSYYYYSVRNRMMFASENLSPRRIRQWQRSSLQAAKQIFLRGGYRQLAHPIAPLNSIIRGLRDGRRIGRTALQEHRSKTGPRILRSYSSVRSAHFERDADRDVTILYRSERYDADATAGLAVDLRRMGLIRTFFFVLTQRFDVIEVNEPLYVQTLLRTATVLTANALRRAGGFGAPVVSYAIENRDPFSSDMRHLNFLRRSLRLAAARWVWRSLDRVAFGTDGARRLYSDRLGPEAPRTDTRLIPALPQPAVGKDELAKTPSSLVFLGQLSERKGFYSLLRAWPRVLACVPGATLTVVGKGAGEAIALAAAREHRSIETLIDPSRPAIFDVLKWASVLTLPSRRTSIWREQVGLPIVEGLSYGCTVVASTETGLASWLTKHGHFAVEPDDDDALVAALVEALGTERDHAANLAALPAEDGRAAADSWLTTGGDAAK